MLDKESWCEDMPRINSSKLKLLLVGSLHWPEVSNDVIKSFEIWFIIIWYIVHYQWIDNNLGVLLFLQQGNWPRICTRLFARTCRYFRLFFFHYILVSQFYFFSLSIFCEHFFFFMQWLPILMCYHVGSIVKTEKKVHAYCRMEIWSKN